MRLDVSRLCSSGTSMQYCHVHNIGRPVQWASRPLARFHHVSLEAAAASAHSRPCLLHKSKPRLRQVSAAGDAADKTEAAAGTAARPGAEALGRRQHAASEGKWQGDASVRSAAGRSSSASEAAGRSSSAGRGRGRAGRGATPPPAAAAAGMQPGGDFSAAALPTPPGSGHKRTHSEPPAAARSRRGDTPSAAGSGASGRASTLSSGGRGRGRSAPPAGREEAGLRRQSVGRGSGPAGQQQRFAGGRGAAAGQATTIDAPLLTSLIKGSSDAPSLMQLVERYHNCSTFNHIHAAAALTLFAKLVQRQRLPRAQVQVWLDALILAATQQVYAAGPRELVNMLHAVATLQDRVQLQPSDSRFVEQLVAGLESKVSVFNGQDLSNTLWALAIVEITEHRLVVDRLASEAQRQLHQMTEQGLSNSLWALATVCNLEHSHSHFIQAWVKEAEGRLSDFDAQALSNSLWALAKLGHVDCSFTARLLQAARAQLQGFNTQAVSNMAFALATLRYQHPDFIRQLIQQARSTLPDFTSQAVANTLLAMAWLHYNDAAFVNNSVQHLLQHRGSFNRQELCNTLWALCILDHSPAAVLQPLLAEASSALLLPDTVVGHSDEQPDLLKHQSQAYQYLVTMEGQGHISPQLNAQHRQLWEVCQAAWAEQLQQGAHASFTQQQVLQAVRELPGCEGATCEQLTEDGLLSIDVAVQLPDGKKVAVEVDGPMHFMANAPDVPDGSTAWRNRMLQLRSWQVVSVPAVEWSRVGSNADKQRAYLLQRLAQAGVELPLEGLAAKL